MLDHGIEMAIFSHNGRLRGQLTPPKARNVVLRVRQYEVEQSEELCLSLAREVVRGKISNAIAVLKGYRMNHPEAFGVREVTELLDRLRDVESCSSLGNLRGIEGIAARSYFGLFRTMVPRDLGFQGRQRRPPRDPVNALLSFGYVLMGNELQSLLDGIGFDPFIGFYHRLDYGRPSLALDLLEEFRPVVDRFTAGLLNRKVLRREDFVKGADGGVYLDREAKRRYFEEYESELNKVLTLPEGKGTLRDVFRRQADRLSAALTGGEAYRSFLLP
jgi:CRISPR-associated protein Cas1